MSRGIAVILCMTLLLGGCAGMSNTEQRVLSGGDHRLQQRASPWWLTGGHSGRWRRGPGWLHV